MEYLGSTVGPLAANANRQGGSFKEKDCPTAIVCLLLAKELLTGQSTRTNCSSKELPRVWQ